MQIEGMYYFEVYVPVVQKCTVQALLIISLALSLETGQIDFCNVLFQAEIAEETFVECLKILVMLRVVTCCHS